jgi:hypothetical protein
MKSVQKVVTTVAIILSFLGPGVSIKVQAQDYAPKCIMEAARDFKVVIGPGATIEIQRGQQFPAKLYPNLARISINGVWYEVSRNDVNLVRWTNP